MAAPYATSPISTVEDLQQEIGGMGKFQLVLILLLYCNFLPIGWSTQQMTFAGMSPEWYCSSGVRINKTEGIPAKVMHACKINNSYTRFEVDNCGRYRYLSSSVTIVTEWNLVCDLSGAKDTVKTVELCGYLLGVLVAGQLACMYGRKKSTYSMVAFHAIMNFITGFSMSWEMFAACRFFVGVGIGGVLVLLFPYPMEFVPTRWRAALAVIPSTTIGISIFAGIAASLENWSYLHLICGLCAVPGIFGGILVPESPRWLTVTGRVERAEHVYEKIASVNDKPLPPTTGNLLQKVLQKEEEELSYFKNYSYIDLLQDRDVVLRTLSFGLVWFTFAFAYHTVNEELQDLSSDRFMNIFVLAIVELPMLFASIFACNFLGRRVTATFLSCVYSFIFLVCLIVYSSMEEGSEGSYINGLCVTAKVFMGAGWAVLQTWAAEFYPTVTRFVGYGMVNAFARLGFLLAPFILDVEDKDKAIATYVILTILCLLCIAVILTISETKDNDLLDSLNLQPDSAFESQAVRYHVDIPESAVYQEPNNGQWIYQPNSVPVPVLNNSVVSAPYPAATEQSHDVQRDADGCDTSSNDDDDNENNDNETRNVGGADEGGDDAYNKSDSVHGKEDGCNANNRSNETGRPGSLGDTVDAVDNDNVYNNNANESLRSNTNNGVETNEGLAADNGGVYSNDDDVNKTLNSAGHGDIGDGSAVSVRGDISQADKSRSTKNDDGDDKDGNGDDQGVGTENQTIGKEEEVTTNAVAQKSRRKEEHTVL